MEQRVITEDAALTAQIQRGENSAEAALYEKYSARVYYLALSELRSVPDAEDVRTETFVRVIQAVRNGQVRTPESLASFIVGTAHNIIREGFRQRRKAGHIDQVELERRATQAPDPFFIDPNVKRAIEQVISRLKPREQIFLRMYYYEEVAPEEIARSLGIKQERLRLIKSRALKRFKEIYLRLMGT